MAATGGKRRREGEGERDGMGRKDGMMELAGGTSFIGTGEGGE